MVSAGVNGEEKRGKALPHRRGVLKDLRKALGPEAHRLHSPTARTLALELTEAWVDVREFDQAVRAIPF